MVTITDFNDKMFNDKKIVIVQGRIHPGESNSSWVVHGIIEYLLSDEQVAWKLRKNFIFKIVPMINPDGVMVGNYRTSFLGKDMNRLYMTA
jgi:murein tripeptide amidase MpaA